MEENALLSAWSRGSRWHRWDPHVHTPGTGLNDEFKGGWDAYVAAVEMADRDIVALGVTDYLSITGYRKLRQYKREAGRLANIALLFPNVEFRVEPYTRDGKSINVHLLFSPEDPEHEAKIEEALSTLRFRLSGVQGNEYLCSAAGIERLGRDFSGGRLVGRAAYEEGVRQFKVPWQQLRGLRENNPWVAQNALVAIDVSSDDGTSGLSRDDGFKAVREELHKLADIVFSANPRDRRYWLGHGADSAEVVEKKYGRFKPCLHGSDAHSLEQLFRPAEDRLCWIKAEPTFSGLRQVLFEPAERVWIGAAAPGGPAPDATIDRLTVADGGHWLKTPNADLNQGLVAVIGSKGSGKTALADMLAVAGNADLEGSSASFVRKAREHLHDSAPSLRWVSGSAGEARVARHYVRDDFSESDVKYLSQQFVEHLCSEDELSNDLLAEIEAVIFAHLDPSDRLNASSFDELRAARTEPMQESRRNAEARILDLSDYLSVELDEAASVPSLEARLVRLEADRKALQDEITKLVKTEQPSIAQEHEKASQAATQAQERVAALRQQRQGLDLFVTRLQQIARVTADSVAQLERSAIQVGLPSEVLDPLRPRSLGPALQAIAETRGRLDSSIEVAAASPRPDDKGRQSLKSAMERVGSLEMKLNLDAKRTKRLGDSQRALVSKKAEADTLGREIRRIQNGHEERLASARAARSASYTSIFDEIRKEETVLRELYAPLVHSLARGTEHEKKLEFSVRRTVDLEGWAARGEELIDQRKRPRGQKTLEEHARENMLSAWEIGDPAAISAGITKMAAASVGHLRFLKSGITRRDFARWLFSTEHISLRYGIGFDRVDLKNLSPGTKGIVLLILYLAVDTADRRPLVIDQPEENLDPKSVYDVLVPYFREAKRRRQIVIITHNANLVVNTDAEQIIVAFATRVDGQALPVIEYTAGALEESAIRDAVCDILEGGRRAFAQRERKYGLG